jgi:hypothetical protein
MVACKKESFSENARQAPEDTTASVATSRAAALRANKSYLLTRKANDSLIYGGDGRLAQVQHDGISYTKYNYGFNSIIAKTYVRNLLTSKVIYFMNANKGRTYESKHTVYQNVAGGMQAI